MKQADRELIKRFGNPVLFPAATEGESRGWFVPNPQWLENLDFVAITDDQWVAVHGEVQDTLQSVWWDIFDGGYWVPKQSYGFSPRHMLRDPARPLSKHALGLAVDYDWDDNPYGYRTTTIPEYVIKAHERHGWVWGGRWKYPDPTHFEFET